MNGRCILCDNEMLENIMTIEAFPKAAQNMPTKEEVGDEKGEPLKVCQCRMCGLIQLNNRPVDYYKDVIRAGGFSKAMQDLRFHQFKHFISTCCLEGKKIIEVGCGQGEFVDVLNRLPVEAYGIENLESSVVEARAKGLKVEKGFAENKKTIISNGPFDAFVSINFLEHQPRPKDYLQAIYANLKDDAYGFVTIPDSLVSINHNGYFDLVRDHIAYYTDETARLLLTSSGFQIIESGNTDKYTLYYIVKKRTAVEKDTFLHRHEFLLNQLVNEVSRVKKENRHIAVWGASHVGFTILATTEVGEYVDYIIDSALFKQGKYAPSSHIPIVSPEYYFEHKVECIIIMALVCIDEIARTIREKYGDEIEILYLHASDEDIRLERYID